MFTRLLTTSLVLTWLVAATSPLAAQVATLQQHFQTPPDESRVMMRWWWFGPAVTHEQIEKEMKLMKAGGIGGFEVQPLYPLAVDGERPGLKNIRITNADHTINPEFLEAIKFTAAKAKELGLRMDLTLGSGWPYGGPQFSRSEAAGRLETQVLAVPDGVATLAIPELGDGKKLMAAFIGPANSGIGGRGGRGGGGGGARGRGARGGDGANEAPAAPAQPDPLAAAKLKLATIENGSIVIPADLARPAEVVLFISGQTGMLVKRPSAGAEGFVIDHLNSEPVDRFIREIGEPMLAACMPNPPYAIFCDSLEIGGENWTPDMLEEFQKRRGYDLKPLLPALVANVGDQTMEIRHDWMQTVTELFNEEFNSRFQALAKKYHTRYRLQGYGSPAAALYSFATADLNEAEGFNWQTFDESRWASSASHLLNRPVTSSETWTWLGQVVFRARPIDMKAEADIHFLQGINQFIGHGWPYTAEGAAYPGWSMYAAAVFNQNNPWWLVMPDVTSYLQRNSQMMREGVPANDVLVYMPNSDGWASTNSSLNAALGGVVGGGGRGGGRGGRGGGGQGTGNITGSLLAAGYNLDYFDDQLLAMKGKVEGNQIAFGDTKYRAVVLPPVERILPDTMRTLEQFARNGGIVIAVGAAPQKAPGHKATEDDQQTVTSIGNALFAANGRGVLVPNADGLGAALTGKGLSPDFALATPNADIGFVHRHTSDAEIYFVANTSNQPVDASAKFRVTGMQPEIWNAMSGTVQPAISAGETVKLSLAPFESTLVVFTKRTLPAVQKRAVANLPEAQDLSTGWTVKFGADGPTVTMDQLKNWIDDEKTKAFSGVATYTRTVNVPQAALASGAKLILDFGEVTAQGGGGRGGNGYRANAETPVREGAVVTVNGKRVGALWTAPYKLDVTSALRGGDNELKIEVGNLALNHMAANGYPNYNLQGIRQVYGNRFDPQGLNMIVPTPSGLAGPIKLVPTAE